MADPQKPNFFNSMLQSLGLSKAEPLVSAPKLHPGKAHQESKSGDLLLSSRQTDGLAAKPAAPLSKEEKDKESVDRHYLIDAYETMPTLIPEFQNPQYMYKLISNERDYVQENLDGRVKEHKLLRSRSQAGVSTPEEDARYKVLEKEIQSHRNELSRLFLLIKKVTGVNKSGTGGTDFLGKPRV
ncbi:MAG TPA: hypothetical protein DD435_07995 [Cyanobacteria bacterium UBA8530]|nr:hypothetical protein [Cyanobacteria bacterium UBA8530]